MPSKAEEILAKLSNQAKWYLTGNWPISDVTFEGRKYSNAEPVAMAELVRNGLAIEMPAQYPHARYWTLTITGVAARKVLRRE